MIDITYGSAYVGGRLPSAFQLTLALLFSDSGFFGFFSTYLLDFSTAIPTLFTGNNMGKDYIRFFAYCFMKSLTEKKIRKLVLSVLS